MSVSTSRYSMTSFPFWGSILGFFIGAVFLVLALAGQLFLPVSPSAPLVACWALAGVAELATSYYALRRVRIGWAFSVAINGTIGFWTIFAAPKIRDVLETYFSQVHIAVALVPSLLFWAVVLLHTLERFDETGSSQGLREGI